jgi:transcriptional regulator with XRE-family HTH domain
MANKRNLRFVRPDLDAVLAKPSHRMAFEEASAALEGGRLVRGLRTWAGFSQIELAHRLGVSQPRVSAIEAGTGRDGLTYALLKRIVTACGGNWDLSAFLPAEAVLADMAESAFVEESDYRVKAGHAAAAAPPKQRTQTSGT